jgi:hypothetical protein
MHAVVAGLFTVILSLLLPDPSFSTPKSLPALLEDFVVEQFPGATSHFWIINGVQWQEENELVVDLEAVVTRTIGQHPTESRYLILIVSGRLAAAQRIPLEGSVSCEPEPA